MPTISLSVSLRSHLRSSGSSLSSYAVNNFDPSLVFDFEQNYYRTGGTDSTLSSSVTHSATSNATMTDSDGNIKWRPHNLLKYSEAFDNSYWNDVRATVETTTETVDLTGSNGAYKLTQTSTTGGGVISHNTSQTAGDYTFSVYAKEGTNNVLQLGGSGSADYASYDLSLGSIISTGSNLVSSNIQSVGNGWYRCSVTRSVSSSLLYIYQTTPASVGDSIYIYGAHAYRSDLGGMVNNSATGDSYVPTTSSAVYLPRVGHHIYNGNAWVNEGVLHESEARTNLVLYSSDMSNMAWVMQGLDTVVSRAGGESDPAGGTAAHIIVANTGNSEHRVYDNVAVNGVRSVYAKAGTANYLSISKGTQASGYAVFNLSSGEIESQANIDTALIENVGNGWYRCSIIGGVNTSYIVFNMGTTATNVLPQTSWTGAGEYFYLWGAQAEAESTPSSYIPTSGSTVTRAADTLTVPAANMPYPETVYTSGELVTNGTFDSNINDWTLSDANGTIVWDASGAISLTGGSGTVYASQPFTTVSGGLYELKITGPSSGNIHLAVGTSENNQSLLYAAVTGTRTFTFIASSTTTHVTFREFSGTGPTLVSNISIKEFNPLYVSIQMDGRMTYADNSTTTANSDVGGEVTFFRWRLSNSDWLGSMVNAKSPKVGQVNFRQKYSGAVDFTQTAEDYYNYANSPVSFNIASRHGSTFINGATDGTALTANTTPKGLPNLSATNLNLGYRFMGTIGKFRVWSDDLTDTGIATASAPSTEPSLQLTFDGSSTSSFTVLDWSE